MNKSDIRIEAADQLIVGKPMGFWSPDDLTAYRGELLNAIDRVGNGSDLVIALSEYPVESSEVVDQYRLTEELAAKRVRRLDMVAAPPLLRMQIRRAALAVIPHFRRDGR